MTYSFSTPFVCRLSALRIGAVDALRSPLLRDLVNRYASVQAALDADRDEISDLLYAEIGVCVDPDVRRSLVRLRRDLFNLRHPQVADVEVAQEAIRVRVCRVSDGLSERDALEATITGQFDLNIVATRQSFRDMLSNELFQKGLLASSRSLYESQQKYLHSEPDALSGRLRRVERGLLKYFKRSAMKATPFGTFCTILPGRIDPTAPVGLQVRDDLRTPVHHVRLNKHLYQELLAKLLAESYIRSTLDIELNPTLESQGERVRYLTSLRGREVFQRVEGAGIGLVASVLTDGPAPWWRVVDYVADATESSSDVASAYLDKLLDVGFVRFKLGIHAQDIDWDRKLVALLETRAPEAARDVISGLTRLRELSDRYEHSSAAERAEILSECRSVIAAVIGPRARNTAPLYEDISAQSEASLSLRGPYSGLAEDVTEFVHLTAPLNRTRLEQATMRHFFGEHYGLGRESVPLLVFYEDFYREHLKEATSRDPDSSVEDANVDPNNPFSVGFNDKLQWAYKNVRELLESTLDVSPLTEEVSVGAEDLRGVADIPPASEALRSYSFFGEVIPPSDRTPARFLGTKNIYMTGYGKMMSRFLYMFDTKFTDTLSLPYDRSEDIYAEISGDSNFNANLHLPILPYELNYPTYELSSDEETISPLDIEVRQDPVDSHSLILIHRLQERRVIPVDLGFQTRSDRPPLYQLLTRFTPSGDFALPFPEFPPAADGSSRDLSTFKRPRIVFKESLVLARREWAVRSAAIPDPQTDISDVDYFIQFNVWRAAQGIPSEGYVRIHRDMQYERITSDSPADEPTILTFDRSLRNLLKPQYFDFTSPFMLDLLRTTLVQDWPFVLRIEERYPQAGDTLVVDGSEYACELVIQVESSYL